MKGTTGEIDRDPKQCSGFAERPEPTAQARYICEHHTKGKTTDGGPLTGPGKRSMTDFAWKVDHSVADEVDNRKGLGMAASRLAFYSIHEYLRI